MLKLSGRISNIVFFSAVYAVGIGGACLVNYIDLPAVKRIYLPIFIVCILAFLLDWRVFAWFLGMCSLAGLAAEMILNTFGSDRPGNGALLNAALITGGALTGAAVQLLCKK